MDISGEFFDTFGRESGGLLRPYRLEGAETVVVALGSVNGTIQEAVDELREDGLAIGSVSICSFRPFPLEAAARALSEAKRVVVIEDTITTGGSAKRGIDAVRAAGGSVVGVLALVDREEGGREKLEAEGVPVISLVTADDIVPLIRA